MGRSYIVPEPERERLGFSVPYKFEKLDLPAGPRDLPSWACDAHINWRWGFSNRPDYLLRCRHDPLAFTKDPIWRRFTDSKHVGWLAEGDGVATCHYHDGAITMQDFEDNVTDDKGHIVWIEKPDWKANKPGVPQTRKYSMLATTKQEGYGGRHFDITLAEQEIPIFADGKRTMTRVEAGTKLRLRGPWHGGAPKGYCEVSYQYDREPYVMPKRRAWHRRWHQRVGFFGLCIKPEVLLDIMATFLPHVEWAAMTFARKDGDEIGIEPLHIETGLPKGWRLDPAHCDHDFMISNYSVRPAPSDDCRWCNAKRDPNWRPRDHKGNVCDWWSKREAGLTFDRYIEQVPA